MIFVRLLLNKLIKIPYASVKVSCLSLNLNVKYISTCLNNSNCADQHGVSLEFLYSIVVYDDELMTSYYKSNYIQSFL
jgi:hypothetical protein